MSITTLIGAFANIFMNYFFIKLYGPIGAAVATLLSYIIVYISRYYFAQKIYAFQVNVKNDLICYFLLISQMIIVCIQFFYTYILSGVIFAIVFIIRFKSIKEMILLGKNMLANKFKQEVT
jgi:O-antigen/teichoic acid export membrane protein